MKGVITRFHFSQAYQKLPQLNLSNLLHLDHCKQVAQSFKKYGCIIVQDPRVTVEDNMIFLGLMKKYFKKRYEQIDRGEFVDVYKNVQYQIGLTPPCRIVQFQERQKAKKLSQQHKPLTLYPLKPMKALRYLWNVGQVTDEIPQNRPPADFPEFKKIMDSWGNSCLNTVITITEMLQIGLGLKKGVLSQKLIGGPHKLGPLGFDMKRMNLGEAFASVHDDFSYMTIHGRSTLPGLFIWLPTGEKIKVRVPEGYLLIQAGTDLQYITGGYIQSGLHQSIYTQQAYSIVQKELQEGKDPWRLTSTMFLHLHSDFILQPQGHFLTSETMLKYPAVRQHNHMMNYLKIRPRI